jgi:broad specificity phosphatase PhoE
MDTSTRLYLIRHGVTLQSAEDRFSSAVGVDLSDEGRWQASRLAERLLHEQLAALYSSPLSRAMDTAAIVAGDCGLPIETRDGLREIDHGHWEGLTRRDVESRFADEYAAWEEDPFTFSPQGGESGVAVLARTLPVIRDIVITHPGQRVLVVSHKATIRLVLCSLLGIDGRGYRDRLDQAPACLNVLEFRDPVRARLMLMNDTSHYASHPRDVGPNLSRWWDRPYGSLGSVGSNPPRFIELHVRLGPEQERLGQRGSDEHPQEHEGPPDATLVKGFHAEHVTENEENDYEPIHVKVHAVAPRAIALIVVAGAHQTVGDERLHQATPAITTEDGRVNDRGHKEEGDSVPVRVRHDERPDDEKQGIDRPDQEASPDSRSHVDSKNAHCVTHGDSSG